MHERLETRSRPSARSSYAYKYAPVQGARPLLLNKSRPSGARRSTALGRTRFPKRRIPDSPDGRDYLSGRAPGSRTDAHSYAAMRRRAKTP